MRVNDIEKDISHYLRDNPKHKWFRRRMVLIKHNHDWVVISTSIVAITTKDKNDPKQIFYPNATLYEDYVDLSDLLSFYLKLREGESKINLYDMTAIVKVTKREIFSKQFYRNNYYMAGACKVLNTKVDRSIIQDSQLGPLASMRSPFFPDINEAEKFWLNFRVYHGDRDSRQGDISLLLPESRVTISTVKKVGSVLVVTTSRPLNEYNESLKISAWTANNYQSLEPKELNDEYTCVIPDETSRIDVVLIINEVEIVDIARISDFQSAIGDFDTIEEGKLEHAQLVEDALESGEGLHVEFKPFVDLKDTKFREVEKTVVALSNAKGGTIYFGISDECEVVGLDNKNDKFRISRAYGDKPIIDLVHDYIKDLKRKINDVLINHSSGVTYRPVEYGDKYLVVITVPETTTKPAHIKDKDIIWVRRGSNNAKVRLAEYKSVICS